MHKSAAALGAHIAHRRATAHAKTTTVTPHPRRSMLTHATGALVTDTVTGQEGVILSGKKTHVLAPTAA